MRKRSKRQRVRTLRRKDDGKCRASNPKRGDNHFGQAGGISSSILLPHDRTTRHYLSRPVMAFVKNVRDMHYTTEEWIPVVGVRIREASKPGPAFDYSEIDAAIEGPQEIQMEEVEPPEFEQDDRHMAERLQGHNHREDETMSDGQAGSATEGMAPLDSSDAPGQPKKSPRHSL